MYHCKGKVKAGRGRGGRIAKKSGKISDTSVSAATTMGDRVTTTATSKASSTSSSSSFPGRPQTSAAASTASAAPPVMASYFYGRAKKSIKKQVELPLQQSPPPPMTPPMPLPTVPSFPKKQLTAAETESETLSSSLPHENDLECDAPLSPTTADMLYTLTPQDLQNDLEKGQEGYSVRSRTGSSSLFSSAPNSPSPSLIVEEEFCDDDSDTDLVPSTPAMSNSSTSSPSVTVVALASATASTTGVLSAAAISALNRDEQGQGAASRRSKVWKYFQTMEAGGFFAKCKLCGKQVSRGKKLGHLSNTGMNLHLKNYHHSTLLRAEAEKKDGSAGSSITDSDCTGGTSSTTPFTQSPANREGPSKTNH